MTTSRTIRTIVAGLAATVAGLACAVVPAFAETGCSGCEPWWHLTSFVRPSYLQPGEGRDEVVELRLADDEGRFTITEAKRDGGIGEEPGRKKVSISAEASAGEVQRQLEEGVYGAGNVRVRTVPGPVGGRAFRITFVGELEDQWIVVPEVAKERVAVSASEVSRGRPDGVIVVNASNVGDAIASSAVPVTVRDVLPAGVKPLAIESTVDEAGVEYGFRAACILASLTCTFTGQKPANEIERAGQPYATVIGPYMPMQVRIAVKLTGASAAALNEASITGGGAPPVSIKRPLGISSAPMPFGVSSYELDAEEPGGAPDTRAGSHPFQLTTTLLLNETVEGQSPALVKDLSFKLPAGLIGNPQPFPHCTLAQFLAGASCSAQDAVGVARVYASTHVGEGEFASGGSNVEAFAFDQPLYNIEPEVGEPARFGFMVVTAFGEDIPVLLDTSVRAGGDYGVTVDVKNITQSAVLLGSEVTFWGVPGDPRHNSVRGGVCLVESILSAQRRGLPEESCHAAESSNPPPLLSLPTSCTGGLVTSVEADSWREEGVFSSSGPAEGLPGMEGCNRLPFTPSLKVTPDSTQASKPSGLSVDVHVPQDLQLNATGLAESEVKNVTVALPEGLALNASAADGLESCSLTQIGFTGVNAESGADEFTDAPVSCPDASKIATATIHSPLLPAPLTGFVYLAAPQNFAGLPQNPFSSLVAMYIVAEDKEAGVLVKLPGSVSLSPSGQVTTTFANTPQLPFEDAELSFFGGERAPLSTPARCGSYTTNASYTPWSGNEPAPAQGSFAITSGPNGSACPGSSLPFTPSLASGTTNNNAGGFSALTTTLSRPDGDQPLQSVTLHYPPGVSGLLSGVELCPEPQANEGTCSANSQIGETIVSVGVGGDPFTVTGGKAYITGPYNGTGVCTVGSPGCAPFGLSIVNPAKAGPFDLQEGRPVVVRAKVEVDPTTAALTIITNTASEGRAIPSIIEGFPLQIQHVNVLINRPSFSFNPTNCNPMKLTGQVDGAEGASAPVEVPFQAANCQNLGFAPKFAVSTQGKTSKANGASLTVKLTYPKAPFGSQANIKLVKVELPKVLPSRLTTLQKACTAAQFETNPAGCPAASVVGHARAVTPLLPVPLEGPAYFVSHGGEAFPSLIMVLQGYGVKLDLVGTTYISHAGITSSTFKTVPDAPVGEFQLTLPEGPYSALAANNNLCNLTKTVTVKKKVTVNIKGHKQVETRKVSETEAISLTMPTEFLAQNGAKINESTVIGVTGCGKAKKTKKHEHAKSKHKQKRSR